MRGAPSYTAGWDDNLDTRGRGTSMGKNNLHIDNFIQRIVPFVVLREENSGFFYVPSPTKPLTKSVANWFGSLGLMTRSTHSRAQLIAAEEKREREEKKQKAIHKAITATLPSPSAGVKNNFQSNYHISPRRAIFPSHRCSVPCLSVVFVGK